METPHGELVGCSADAANRQGSVEFVHEFGYHVVMSTPSGTAWVFSPDFLEHNSGLNHPECPERLTAILSRLAGSDLIPKMIALEVVPATDDELAKAHTRRHMDTLSRSEEKWFDPDTFCGEGTPQIARLAAGAVLNATRAVMDGEFRNAFCAVRPPGHHATAERAMGFCFFNNVAVAAANIVASNPDLRVLILDWDVHHGNGTQAIFYESNSVLYASTHQYPFYPGTGAANETGRGAGRGYTINKPVAAGAGDREFLDAISSILDETLALMKPDLIMISAGFDAHHADPLASLNVSVEGFSEATRRVCAFADAHCQGRIVSVLEGGYNLDALGDSVAAHVAVLVEMSKGNP
jgi:acetoin utilization deacetylase AcuC-like enzyme